MTDFHPIKIFLSDDICEAPEMRYKFSLLCFKLSVKQMFYTCMQKTACTAFVHIVDLRCVITIALQYCCGTLCQ